MIWVVLNVDMAMAAIEIPMAMKCFGQPGIDLSDFCGSALMMSQKSSSEPSMMARLMSVTDLVIYLKGSSCFRVGQVV